MDGGDLSSSIYSNSPKYNCASYSSARSSECCPQKPLLFVTQISPFTCTWHARRRLEDCSLDPCGGKFNRSFSRAFLSLGSIAPSLPLPLPLISTAHVPQVPNPLQLIKRDFPLWGLVPRLSIAVLRTSPFWIGIVLVLVEVSKLTLTVSWSLLEVDIDLGRLLLWVIARRISISLELMTMQRRREMAMAVNDVTEL